MLKRLLSYIFPRIIEVSRSEFNEHLEVTLINGRYMLDAKKVNYAFGKLNNVWRSAFNQIHLDEQHFVDVLILGLGPGNIVTILHSKKNHYQITGVEIDKEVIRLGEKYFSLAKHPNLNIVVNDASAFLRENKKKYDLICVDLFMDDVIPSFAEQHSFFHQLISQLNPGGVLLYNRLMHTPALEAKSEQFTHEMKKTFPAMEVIKADLNRILVFRKDGK